MPPLIEPAIAAHAGCLVIGLEVPPVYRSATGVYPMVLRALAGELARALQRGFFEFTRVQTPARPEHYQMMGRRYLVRSVREADRALGRDRELVRLPARRHPGQHRGGVGRVLPVGPRRGAGPALPHARCRPRARQAPPLRSATRAARGSCARLAVAREAPRDRSPARPARGSRHAALPARQHRALRRRGRRAPGRGAGHPRRPRARPAPGRVRPVRRRRGRPRARGPSSSTIAGSTRRCRHSSTCATTSRRSSCRTETCSSRASSPWPTTGSTRSCSTRSAPTW